MKYLAKHYLPAEKEFLKLVEEFRKMIKLEEEQKKKLPPDALEFLDALYELIEQMEINVGHRISKQEEKEQAEAERRATLTGECPRCRGVVEVTYISEIKLPKTGYIHDIVKCKVCKKEFTNIIPQSDEHLIKWQENMLKQLHSIEPDGRPMWQCAGIPETEVKELEQKLVEYKAAVEAEKQAFKQSADAQAAINKAIEEMRDELLVLRLQILNFNGGNAKA